MKFIHIADLHLGKIIYQQNLLSLQEELLGQVIDYMNEENIPVLVIAGDIYDRSVPSSEAITVLNSFLYRLIVKYHKKVIMISGNHDSSERLQFASDLLKDQGLYIVTYPEKELKPIIIEDVNFYLVPFFKPSYIRYLYNDDTIHTYQEAFATYLKYQQIDTTKNNVLVTHQFVAGNKEPITSESEVILSVGGTEIIDVNLFNDFDYVALGHLHASQKMGRETVRYSGSLMKYSFDEVQQEKGMVEVEIHNKEVHYKIIPLHPSKDLKKYQGTYASFLEEGKIENKDDYISFSLEDTMIVPNAIDQLRQLYPNVLQITYPKLLQQNEIANTKASDTFENLDMHTLYQEFYQNMTGEELSDDLLEILDETLGDDEHVA
ncbi:MAG: exonuclease SbcCD subunit D [Coprobacillaceae bacterium]